MPEANCCSSCGDRLRNDETFTLKKGTRIFFGMPQEDKIPKMMILRMTELFENIECVEKVFITQAYVPSSNQPPSLFLAVKLSKGSKNFPQIAPLIRDIIKVTLPSSQSIDIVEMTDQQIDWMTTKHVWVFYSRKN